MMESNPQMKANGANAESDVRRWAGNAQKFPDSYQRKYAPHGRRHDGWKWVLFLKDKSMTVRLDRTTRPTPLCRVVAMTRETCHGRNTEGDEDRRDHDHPGIQLQPNIAEFTGGRVSPVVK